MLPSDFQTCKSIGSPLFNIWRAVEIWIDLDISNSVRSVGFLSPLRYESGKPITKRKYRQGRRSSFCLQNALALPKNWAWCERLICVSSEPSGISGIELVIEDAGSQRSVHKLTVWWVPPSEFYLVEFYVGVGKLAGKISNKYREHGVKIRFFSRWQKLIFVSYMIDF